MKTNISKAILRLLATIEFDPIFLELFTPKKTKGAGKGVENQDETGDKSVDLTREVPTKFYKLPLKCPEKHSITFLDSCEKSKDQEMEDEEKYIWHQTNFQYLGNQKHLRLEYSYHQRTMMNDSSLFQIYQVR